MQLQIQYLRAAAALCVLYYHIAANLKNSSYVYVPDIYEIGSAGVDLFFVISGYIMAKIIWEKPFRTGSFISNRLWRITPLYWSATLFVFLIAVLAPSLLGSTMADIGQLVHSLLFIPNGAAPHSTSPTLVVGWTLNYEMFFYATIVACVGFFRDKSLALTATALGLLVLLGNLVEPENNYLVFYTDPIILEFTFGIAVFHIVRLQDNQLPKYIAYPVLAVSLSVMAITTATGIDNHRVLLWGVPAAFALYAGLSALTFNAALFKQLGDWSYEIYIVHVFIIAGGMKLILPYIDALPLAETVKVLLFATILTIITVITSAVTNRFFAYTVPQVQKFFARTQTT
jgi:peptidoglycan/LPS O-acetylase OafA/YrhL